MATLGVQILGDARGLKAALGSAAASTEEFGTVYKTQFSEMSASTVKLALAQDKLAVATAKYGVGSRGAAAAALAYRQQIEQAHASQLASMQKVGRGLSLYVTAPMVLATYEAAKMGVEFNRQMLLIQTQAGASAAEVKRLTGEVEKMAPAVGMGPTQLAQGLYHLESLGLRGSAALRTLRISAIAAGMGIANLEDVTTALGGVVVTGIQGAQNYQQAMATLTATVGAGNMRFEDLASSIGNVAPAASAAGITLPELGAAMATLTDRGFSADEAATRLRMSLSLIQSPSKRAQKALKDMGVDANSLGAMLRQPGGLLKVLETLNQAVERVGATRGNRDLLAGFGGGRSGLGIQTLVQSLNQGLSSYQQKLQDVSAGEQKYAQNQKTYMESPSFRLHKALATIETDLTKIGQDLLPAIARGADAVAAFANAFAKLPGPVKDAFGIIGVELAVGGPLLIGIAAAIRAMQTLKGTFVTLPAVAGPASAETGAEIATGVGAGVATAEAEVAGLRTSLLALSAGFTVPITLALIGAPGLIKLMHWGGHGVSQGFGGQPQSGGTFAQTHPTSDYSKWSPEERAAEAAKRDHYRHDYSWYLDHPQATLGILNRNTSGMSNDPMHDAADRRQAAPSAAAAAGAVGGFRMSEASRLNLALARNPNSRSAIEAKLAYDQQAAAFAEKRIAEGRGSKSLVDQLKNVYADENSLRAQLASMDKKNLTARKKAAKQFEIPLALQLREAEANASGVQSKQVAAAKAIKAWALMMIHSKRLTEQQMIDAYNLIAQENSTIGTHVKGAENFVKASTSKLTAGRGLSRGQRLALEQRYAQAEAHNGHIPRGIGVGGQVVTINVHGVTNPDAVADAVVKKIARKQKANVVQTRGRRGGVSVIP